MKKVVLTSGPRGAGKSTYINNYVKQNPETIILSRDELLIELFGQTALSPYDGSHEYARQLFSDKIKKTIESNEHPNLIVDCWNGYPEERESAIEQYKLFGADKVICWKFMTPKETCIDWAMKKEDISGYTKPMMERDFDTYHRFSKNILEEGFDQVRFINPLQLEIPFLE